MRKTGLMAGAAALAMAQAAWAEESYDLDGIVIEGDVADSSTSYVLPEMRSAAKTDTPVAETPQALTVLTRKQFDDQNTQTVGQALRYTSGVLSEVDASTRYDSVFLRGFGDFGTSSNFVSYLDGLRLPKGQAFAQMSIDPFLLDRVDVLKGPSSLLYGASSPGGLVNMVTRTPDDTTGGEARLEYGSYNRVRAGFDQHGLLDDDSKLQYSVTALAETAGSRYDDVDESSYAIAPKVVWQPTDSTRLTLGAFWEHDPEGGYFNSIYPTFLAGSYAQYLTRDFNVGDPSFDSFERTEWGVTAGIEHGITPDLTIRSKLRYAEISTYMQGIQMGAALSTTGELTRMAVRSDEAVRGFTTDTSLEYDMATGAVQHRVLAGTDFTWNEADWVYDYTLASTLDVTDPVYDGVSGPFYAYTDSLQTTRQAGLYLSDQASLGNLRAIVGLRRDWISTDSDNRLTETTTSQDSNDTTYRAALLYHFDNGLAPYASYATSFEPTIGTDENGDPFVPTKAKQWEIGLKYQPGFADMLLTAAAFDITQENVKTPGATAGYYIQTGEIRSRGLEFEARGKATDRLELIAALTLMDTEVTKSSDSTIIGNRPQAVPDHFGSLWANYAMGGPLEGLEVGGGVRFVGASYGDDENTVKAPAYTLYDLAMRYDLGQRNPQLEGFELTLNIRNLLDEIYYSSCSYDYYCQYGEGRTFIAGLRKSW